MNKAAIVTGASSGIGLAISRVLCELNYDVYGFGRDFEREETAQFVQSTKTDYRGGAGGSAGQCGGRRLLRTS